MLKKISLFVLSVTSLFAMHTAEINVNEYDLEAGLKLDVGQFNTTVEPDTTFVGIDYIKGSGENDSIVGDGNDVNTYINFNFMVKQNIRNTGFYVGLGVKAVYTSIDNSDLDYMALPIGGELSYVFANTIPVGITLSASYAPQSLSFLDSKDYLEYRFEVFAQLMNRASLYLGYRNIDTNYEDSSEDYTYNKSGYFGIKFAF